MSKSRQGKDLGKDKQHHQMLYVWRKLAETISLNRGSKTEGRSEHACWLLSGIYCCKAVSNVSHGI